MSGKSATALSLALLVLLCSGTAWATDGAELIPGLTGAGGGLGVVAALLAWERLRGKPAPTVNSEEPRLAVLESGVQALSVRLERIEAAQSARIGLLAELRADVRVLLERG
jgi:hypothetical protein